jgi:hypothetical protein
MRGRRDRLLDEIEELYRARFPYFAQVARAIVGDRERAVEAVQDGFADAIRGRAGFRGDGALEPERWPRPHHTLPPSARKATIITAARSDRISSALANAPSTSSRHRNPIEVTAQHERDHEPACASCKIERRYHTSD